MNITFMLISKSLHWTSTCYEVNVIIEIGVWKKAHLITVDKRVLYFLVHPV